MRASSGGLRTTAVPSSEKSARTRLISSALKSRGSAIHILCVCFTSLSAEDQSQTHQCPVKEARRQNRELAKKKVSRKKRIQIVKYDWLEDSLQGKSRKPKPTAPYDWEQKRLGREPAPASPQPLLPQTSEQEAAAKTAKMDRKSEDSKFQICLAD